MIPMVVFCLLGPRAGVASTVVVMLEAWLFFYISSSGTPATTLCSWRWWRLHAPLLKPTCSVPTLRVQTTRRATALRRRACT